MKTQQKTIKQWHDEEQLEAMLSKLDEIDKEIVAGMRWRDRFAFWVDARIGDLLRWLTRPR